jgi:hypothetical protein
MYEPKKTVRYLEIVWSSYKLWRWLTQEYKDVGGRASEYPRYPDILILSLTGKFYEQTDDMAMCSPLFPVNTSFFIEDF